MSSCSLTEVDDSVTKEKMNSTSPSKPNVSGTPVKIESCSPPEPSDPKTLEKISSCRSSEPDACGTQEKISSCSSTDLGTLTKGIKSLSFTSPPEPDDSSTLEKNRYYSPPEPDSSDKLVTMFDKLIHGLALDYISIVNKEAEGMEQLKEKDRLIRMFRKKLADNSKISNESRKYMEFKGKMKPSQENGLMYNDRFSACKKMGTKSRLAIKSIIIQLSDLLKQLIDGCNAEINKLINAQMNSDDGFVMKLQEAHNSLLSDDILCRSLAITVIKTLFRGDFKIESSNPKHIVVIDGILDKSTQARKCANWFLYKSCNLEILCDDIQYTWIYNSLMLTSYADIMDTSLGLNHGEDKAYMYDIYYNHQKGDFEKLYLSKFHQGQIDLEQSDTNYKMLEARKPRFERSRLCKSEHNTPFCELCGWPSTWLKTFKKRGINIKEAPDWTSKHIWYNEIKDESDE